MWEIAKNGSLYLAERTTDRLTGKSRILTVKILSNTPRGRKEAQKRLRDKLEGEQETALHLSDLIRLYNAEHQKAVRESTYIRDASSLATMLSVTDDILIDRMTAGYIRRKLVESGKENSTCNELIKRFKTFLMWAYRNDYIGREVADKLTLFPDKSAREKIADKFLEREELLILVNAMGVDRWKLLTEFLALSGLRIGEAVALNSEDVDEEYIYVTKTYNESLKLMGDTKTASSARDVYVQPELAEVIRKIRISMMKQRMFFGYEDKGFFFAGIDGDRIGYAAYRKYLHQIAEQTGIRKTIVPHTLRHTMTSLFAEAGVPLDVISRRLGHESSTITKRIYLHITENRKIKDNKEVSSVFLLA